jgi:hypothetical protein
MIVKSSDERKNVCEDRLSIDMTSFDKSRLLSEIMSFRYLLTLFGAMNHTR